VGATTLVFDSYNNLLLPDKLWKFIWKDKNNVSPIFIWQLLSNDGIRKRISRLSTGSGGSMKNISKANLNTLKIPFPPIKLQKKYEQFYLSLRSSYQNNTNHLNYSNDLFNALSQKSFKGELKIPT
jgi:type I restriction enzyme S subunit